MTLSNMSDNENSKFSISEIFYSLQGEGFLAGVPSVFVRLAGCPLRCTWCDTKYAWDSSAGRQYSVEQIVDVIQQWPAKFIVVTGGEPMVKPNLPDLLQRLKDSGKHITVETAGIAFVPNLACDLMSIGPKLSNSAVNAQGPDIYILNQLMENYEYQLKFVIDSREDLPEIQQALKKLKAVVPEKIMLMPQARTRDELSAKSPMVADMCKQTGFTFCQRLQVLLGNNQRAT